MGASIQAAEISSSSSYLSIDLSTEGFPGHVFGDFMDNSNLPSILGVQETVSVTYENENTPYNLLGKRSWRQRTDTSLLKLTNVGPTMDSFFISLFYQNKGTWEHLATATILGLGPNWCDDGKCDGLRTKKLKVERFNVEKVADFPHTSTLLLKVRIMDVKTHNLLTIAQLETIMRRIQPSKPPLTWVWENGPHLNVIDF